MGEGVGVGCEDASAEHEKRGSRWSRREQGMGVKRAGGKQEIPCRDSPELHNHECTCCLEEGDRKGRNTNLGIKSPSMSLSFPHEEFTRKTHDKELLLSELQQQEKTHSSELH